MGSSARWVPLGFGRGPRASTVDTAGQFASVQRAAPLAATANICDTAKERILIHSVTCKIVFQPLHPVTCVPLHESINCYARGTKFTEMRPPWNFLLLWCHSRTQCSLFLVWVSILLPFTRRPRCVEAGFLARDSPAFVRFPGEGAFTIWKHTARLRRRRVGGYLWRCRR